MFLEEVNNRPRAPPAASYFAHIDTTSERVTPPCSVCLRGAFREPFLLFSRDVQVMLWTEGLAGSQWWKKHHSGNILHDDKYMYYMCWSLYVSKCEQVSAEEVSAVLTVMKSLAVWWKPRISSWENNPTLWAPFSSCSGALHHITWSSSGDGGNNGNSNNCWWRQ